MPRHRRQRFREIVPALVVQMMREQMRAVIEHDLAAPDENLMARTGTRAFRFSCATARMCGSASLMAAFKD
jgi:hypothetical protein